MKTLTVAIALSLTAVTAHAGSGKPANLAELLNQTKDADDPEWSCASVMPPIAETGSTRSYKE